MKKTSKLTLWIMIAGIILCCAARVFSIFNTDMNSGFIVRGKEILCNALYYGILILTTVGAMFTARRGEILEYTDLTNWKSNVLGFATLILALGAAYEGILELNSFSPFGFLAIVDFVFAAAFVVIAFIILSRKEINAGIGFSYAFVGIYFTIRGVCIFNQRMVIASIPEYLLDMLGIVCGAVFFVVLSKYLTGNGGTGKAVCFWGTAGAIIGLSPFLGAVAAKIFGAAEISERITFGYNAAEVFFQTHRGDNAYMMTGLYLMNVLFGAFAAVTVAVLMIGKKPKITDKKVDNNINTEEGGSAL